MKEIFKQIDSWLQKAKDRKSGCNVATSKAFYGGQVSAYINVGLLLQEHITQQAVEADAGKKCSLCGEISGDVICAKCITERINRTA